MFREEHIQVHILFLVVMGLLFTFFFLTSPGVLFPKKEPDDSKDEDEDEDESSEEDSEDEEPPPKRRWGTCGKPFLELKMTALGEAVKSVLTVQDPSQIVCVTFEFVLFLSIQRL